MRQARNFTALLGGLVMQTFRTSFFAAVVTLLIFWACPRAAQASTIIYNNFGTGDAFGNFPSGGSPAFGVRTAAVFTPSVSVTLDSIEVGVFTVAGAQPINLSILSDNSGLPGTFLAGQTVTSPSSGGAILNANFSGSPLLSAGTPYWVEFDPAGQSVNWSPSLSDNSGNAQFSGGWTFSPTFRTPAFRVTGTAVPEPSTFTLVTLALLGMCYRRRQRA